jgi:hypothetical protein
VPSEVIVVDGELAPGDDQKFADAAIRLKDATVILSGPGGDLFVGIGIGEAIRLKGFDTLVISSGRCASACALAWLGGTKRSLGEGAAVGFHAAYTTDGGGQDAVSSSANAAIGAYLTKLGLPSAAIDYVTEPQPDDIQWLTLDDAARVGIDVRASRGQ